MPVCEFKLQYQSSKTEENAAVAIIVAAGSSSRMGGVNKQFIEIDGIPVIARTVSKFENSPFVKRIIIVSRDADITQMQKICDNYAFQKVTDIVSGGQNRHESVMNGFSRIAEDEENVIIHDGARPFVTDGMIKDSVLALCNFDCAVCGIKVVDTVKKADGNENVISTVDRKDLYLAQTPQAVRKKAYIEAVKLCENPEEFTDDASIMENAKKTVKMINGSRKNIKITSKEDLELAILFAKGETV